ncbi:hypothetical protein [Rhizobium leguminosarum]|uniref:hypothetical protein n=1 Tax=Rhizobium leguminosarum TaxID=384 RepID=UPI0017F0C418|nr:hypothetical protein [Rhizobium leguminosarum]MBB4508059.1 hypothetical protein [Rhizobium leguminosarum]
MRNEIEITDEVIEAGLGSPNSTIRGKKLPKEMFPAAIRSILVAVTSGARTASGASAICGFRG